MDGPATRLNTVSDDSTVYLVSASGRRTATPVRGATPQGWLDATHLLVGQFAGDTPSPQLSILDLSTGIVTFTFVTGQVQGVLP